MGSGREVLWKTGSSWTQPKFVPVWVFPGRGLFLLKTRARVFLAEGRFFDDAPVRLSFGVFVRYKHRPGKFFRNVSLQDGLTEFGCIVQSVESNGNPR